jgi:hypothetical protein
MLQQGSARFPPEQPFIAEKWFWAVFSVTWLGENSSFERIFLSLGAFFWKMLKIHLNKLTCYVDYVHSVLKFPNFDQSVKKSYLR